MAEKIKLDGREYSIKDLSGSAKEVLAFLSYVDRRLNETTNMMALLQRAKSSYMSSLKNEIISSKSGLMLD